MTRWTPLIHRILGMPRWQAIACITAASVLGSLLLTVVTLSALGAPQRSFLVALVVATVIPTLVATPVGIVLTRLMHDLDAARIMAQTLASTDPLTGALNRRHFVEKSSLLMGRAVRDQAPCSLLMIDIDDFKKINDRHGHSTGDEVLQMFVRVCTKTLRPSDLLARWGGEEFVALLPATSTADAIRISERLRKAIAEGSVVTARQHVVTLTASIGVAASEDSTLQLEDMLSRADAAMYTAKLAGKNCFKLAA